MEWVMTLPSIDEYAAHLCEEERSRATVQKYARSLQKFYAYLPPKKLVTKEVALEFKSAGANAYAVSTVNGIIAALNGYFLYMEWPLRLKPVRSQRRIFADRCREISRDDYFHLLTEAQGVGKQRLNLIMQTICATGIRVSELAYITVEAVQSGRSEVNCKGKRRVILIPAALCRALTVYAQQNGIRSGPVFITRGGRPVDRSNIWSDMKRLCDGAGVLPGKVFPHNLRHLFARSFYTTERDLAKLADLLGHASIDTTRIYLREYGDQHERVISQLGLLQL